MNLLTRNTKLAKTPGLYSFGIPAFRTKEGFATCPNAGNCVSGCYAKAGFYVRPVVYKAQMERLEATKNRWGFFHLICLEIEKKKVRYLRVHDSGDFYSIEYLHL